MLSSLTIRNFQSLRDVELPLDRFVVITGASNAGKSAIIRALRLLTFNARGLGLTGTSYITTGEKGCMVVVYDAQEERGVAIARSAARGGDNYVINDHGAERTFTKLGGDVPEEVSGVLGLSELNFAAQFDRPFLLDESAQTVARVLGSLTNVTLLFNAAREANRRKSRVKDQLDDRVAEVTRLRTEIGQYVTLRARADAVRTAEERLASATQLSDRAQRLRQLLAAVSTAQARVQDTPAPAPVPSTEQLEALVSRHARLAAHLSGIAAATVAASSEMQNASIAAADADRAEQALHKMLADAGICPLCGQGVREAA